MIELLKSSSYQSGPWKNGKGLTHQIAIFPANASILEKNFLWRISTAEVRLADPFSTYPDWDRKLIVWTGEGLLLNGKSLIPNTPIGFSGEELIHCDPIGHSPVVDFGIIYKKKYIRAELEVLRISLPTTLSFESGTFFLFLAKGENCQTNEVNLAMGDSIKIENENKIRIQSESETNITLYRISLFDSI